MSTSPLQNNILPPNMKLSDSVAAALILFVKLDTSCESPLSFKELREAMVEHNLLRTEQDKAIYDLLVKSEGIITQNAFIDSLHMLFTNSEEPQKDSKSLLPFTRTKHLSASREWSASTIFKGLQFLAEAKEDHDDNENVQENPQVIALANALFYILDVDSSETITIEQLQKRLNEIDAGMFSGDMVDELVEHLDETSTTTVTEKEFKNSFALLATSTNLDMLRQNIEKYKTEQERIEEMGSPLLARIVSGGSENGMDKYLLDQFKNRAQELEKELRQTKGQVQKINQCYESVRQRNSRTESESIQIQKKTEEELKDMEKKMNEMKESEQTYKQKAEAMKLQLKAMEEELAQASTTKDAALRVKEKINQAAKLEAHLDLTEMELQERNKTIEDQKKMIMNTQKQHRRTLKDFYVMSDRAAQVKQLEEETMRLEKENRMLAERADAAQRLLDEQEPEIGPSSLLSLASINIGSINDSYSPLGSLEDICFMAEQANEIDKVHNKLKELEDAIKARDQELARKEQELMERDLTLEEKDLALIERELELKKVIEKGEKRLPLIKTVDPRVYRFGTRTIKVDVEGGKQLVRVGGGYVRLAEFTKRYNHLETRKLRAQKIKKERERTKPASEYSFIDDLRSPIVHRRSVGHKLKQYKSLDILIPGESNKRKKKKKW